jgi:DnaJ like chaperone protein
MSWNGKIIGAAIGSIFGPVGAVLGALVGHQFDTGAANVSVGSVGGAARMQELYFPALFRVMGHVAKADGRVSEREIAAARSMMGALRLDGQQTAAAINYFGEGKAPDFVVDAALAPLQPLLRSFPQLAQFFIEVQLQAALAGNDLAPLPRARLAHVAGLLGLASQDFARLEAMMRWRMGGAGASRAGSGGGSGGGGAYGSASAADEADRLAQAYALLEVNKSASDEQVVKAYRRQMSRHHPDKLKANGLPESMLERAKERTQQIQAAYELLRAVRGMR